MKEEGGLITKKDLASYEALVRKPVRGSYRGYDIYSMPPPSSGGVLLIEMLNMLEGFPLGAYGQFRPHYTRHGGMHEARLRRPLYVSGDPDFVDVPVSRLISKDYARDLSAGIDPERATPSDRISPGGTAPREGGNTTHFSVIDKWGNAVSNTYTLNFSYGSGITVPGTGILLNNEMDDFSITPGVPNAYGLTGGEYNALAPGEKDAELHDAHYSTQARKAVFNHGERWREPHHNHRAPDPDERNRFAMNITEATYAVRVHHQWLPDELRTERGRNADTIKLLSDMGYSVVTGDTMGSAQSIVKIGDYIYGATDPRGREGLRRGIKP